MFKSNFITLRYLYYINVVVTLLYFTFNSITLNGIIIIASIFFLMNPLGIAISYHRYWSHKSFEWKNNFYKQLCTIPALISGVGSILGWVGLHRRHHAKSDIDGDPHLASKGLVKMILMTSYEYEPKAKEVIDLMRDRYIVTTHNYYFLFPIIYSILCFILFGIDGLILGYCAPAALSLITQNITNYVNHYHETHFAPNNVLWINILNFGDGWHKNHHINPKSHTTSMKWWQIDPAGWAIRNIFAKSVC